MTVLFRTIDPPRNEKHYDARSYLYQSGPPPVQIRLDIQQAKAYP